MPNKYYLIHVVYFTLRVLFFETYSVEVEVTGTTVVLVVSNKQVCNQSLFFCVLLWLRDICCCVFKISSLNCHIKTSNGSTCLPKRRTSLGKLNCFNLVILVIYLLGLSAMINVMFKPDCCNPNVPRPS